MSVKSIYLFLFCLISLSVSAQSPCLSILSEAQIALNKDNTERALLKLQDVEVCDDGNDLLGQRQHLQNAIFTRVREQKKEAEDALRQLTEEKERVSEQKRAAEDALQQVEEEKERTQAALDEAETAKTELEDALNEKELARAAAETNLSQLQKMTNAFYFYENKVALAYGRKSGKNMYYFIDRGGDVFTRLGFWEKAELFDYTGLAKTKKRSQEYLLDTMGNYYTAAYQRYDLDKYISAVDFRGTPLKRFPRKVFIFPQLEILLMNMKYKDSKSRTTLPSNIKRLVKLKHFLFLGQLEVLPAEIGELQQLQILDLRNNNLNSLPAEIGQLQNLKTLNLYNNQLNSLPAEIGQLQNLKTLNLYNNQLNSLPAEIGQLQNLNELDVRHNKLTSLPPEFGQLRQFQALDLSNNNLSSLPPEFGELYQLKTLDLSNNNLSSLPSEFGELYQLKTLDLSNNSLDSLPLKFGKLYQLETLDLSRNNLSSLPPEFRELYQLKTLDLSGNNLSSLPLAITKLELDWLDLRGNSFIEIEKKRIKLLFPDLGIIF